MAALPDNAARPVLCGGCSVMSIPTAIEKRLVGCREGLQPLEISNKEKKKKN